MDDFCLFDDSRERLAEARQVITDWLAEKRKLELNPRYGEIFPSGRPSVFLGYRISRSGISPSRKLRRRFRAKVRAAARRGPAALRKTLSSYRGLLTF